MVLVPRDSSHPQMSFRKERTWYTVGLGAEPTTPQGGQTGIEALTPRGLSISWCFTGIRIIQSCISPEERRGESLTGSTTQEQAGQEVRRGFPVPILRPVWLPRMAGDEWAY